MIFNTIIRPERVRDPFTIGATIVTALSQATGVVLTFEAFAAASFVVGSAAIGGGVYALSAASGALSGAQKQSTLAGGQGISTADNGLRLPVRQPIPPQRLALGLVVSSGALFFQRSKPPYIWIGYELASHRCGDFKALLINGVPVPLEDPGTGILRPNSTPFFDGTTRFVEVSYRNGTPGQTIDPLIARDLPDMPSTFRQRRATTVVLKADYAADDNAHKDLYGSESSFNPLFRFEGALLPDPRVARFDPADQETWTYSSNASLALVRYLIHPWPNTRLVDPVTEIDWDRVAEAADIDDRWCGRMEGELARLERNHTADGVILSTDDPLETVKAMLTACDGILVNNRGKYYPVPGARRDPVMTIHQDMIAGAFEFQSEVPDRNQINIIKTEMVAPDREYNVVVGPVLRRDDFIASDGQPLETTLSLPLTVGNARAQRLASRKLFEVRSARSLTMVLTIEARGLRAGNIVRVDLRDFQEVGGIYQVRQVGRESTLGTMQIDLVAWSNERFDWHAPDDQQPFELDEDVLEAEAA